MTTAQESLVPGDPRLIDSPIARRLLDAPELARLAYVAMDGTPRVVPMGVVRSGSRLVMATFATSAKLRALRTRPEVALTIDRAGPPPEVLTVRGRAEVEETGTVPPEYLEMQTRYSGPDQAAAVAAEVARVGARMARITVTPTWVNVLDFQTRFPQGLVDAGLAGQETS